jgi:ADP-ribose pyrophosphatase
VKREAVLHGSRFRVDRFTLTGRDGKETVRELAVHRGAVVILPLLDADTCVLIENTRPMLGKTLLELPAGTREEDEAPLATAHRELEEETGYRAGSLVPVTEFFASPGITDERMFAFLATDLAKGAQALDATEEIRVLPTSITDALAMCRDGRIEDGKTLALLLYYAAFLRRS